VYAAEPKRRVAIPSSNVNNMNPNDIALALDRYADIVVRSTWALLHHAPIKSFTKNDGTVRASAYFCNTNEELNKLVSAVEKKLKT
jgi:selenocysteine lyase/cysteine desulfurase